VSIRTRLRAFLARPTALLRWSAALTLIALALMVWSMIQPTPLPVMLAMTAGQGLGTLALAMYVFVVVQDLRRARREKRDGPP
jgi:purine-cytosine permease-like protein